MAHDSRVGVARKRMLALHLPRTIAEYPFECCLAAWGFLAGIAALVPSIPTPSVALDALPDPAEHTWGVSMFVGAVTMALGLRPPQSRFALLARGMALCGIALFTFGIAVVASVGWPRLATGVLLMLVGLAAGIRASKLKADYYTAVEELTNEHNGGHHKPKEG